MSLKRYLFWFANEHVDFRLNEIKSILALFDLQIKWVQEPTNDPFWVVELDSEHSAKR